MEKGIFRKPKVKKRKKDKIFGLMGNKVYHLNYGDGKIIYKFNRDVSKLSEEEIKKLISKGEGEKIGGAWIC